MKKNWFGALAQGHRFAVAFSLLLLAVLAFSGCDTDQLYNAPNQQGTARTSVSAAPTDHLSFARPASSSPNTSLTTLHEGDVVKISFPASPNLDATEQIRLDGKIALPLVGDVQAAGMTPAQLQQYLIKLYAKQISTDQVTVEVESSSFPVFVTGCVLRPGKVLSNQPMTALEAVMEAGGFDYARANLRDVHVIRRENNTSRSYVLDLKAALNGESQNEFFLKPDDIIYVPEKFSWF